MSGLNPAFFQFLPARFSLETALSSVFSYLPAMALYLVTGFAFLAVLALLHRVVVIRLWCSQAFVFLELKPPRETLKSAYTAQQLFTQLHRLASHRPLAHRLVGLANSYSFEIVATRTAGIRYLVRVAEADAGLIKKTLLSYLPGVSVVPVSDYLPASLAASPVTLAQFSLARHFAFPLKIPTDLKEHDPIAYITGSMTQLAPGQTVAFQLIASPLNKSRISDINRLTRLIYQNRDLVAGLSRAGVPGGFFWLLRLLALGLLSLLALPLGLLIFLVTAGRQGPLLVPPPGSSRKKTANPYQEELEHLVKEKLDQPLFQTGLRLVIVGSSRAAPERVRGFLASLSSFSSASYQSLRRHPRLNFSFLRRYRRFLLQQRLLDVFGNSLLSVSEVAGLYHFPFTPTTQTEDLQKVHSRELPAPVSLKKAANLDTVFAQNTFGGSVTAIGLTREERRRHLYILGATGTGKSTLLLSMISQDIQNGHGLCVIDPHGDLIENILPRIPRERIPDVVYFNPDDISFPMGINLLERTPGLPPEADLKEREFIAESVISLFRKVYDDRYSGPRMEYILRNTIHTAFTLEHPTLFTVYQLLINPRFRKSVTRQVTDENLRDFWKYEFAQAGNYQKVKMISPITNKIGRFLFSPSAKRILEQEKSTISFDAIMDQGKILLCNLSKGRIGEDNSEVFGLVVMAKIQLAALKRARSREADRRDFYLYVDEFQNFATESFGQILSEARKYRLNAVLAHQTTSQLETSSLVQVTLANTGTVICFRTANPEDERLILPQFIPYVQPGEIDNLPSFHFYIKIAALHPEEPFSGKTMLLDVPDNEVLVKQIIEASREHFAKQFIATVSTFKPKAIANKRNFKTKINKKSEVFPD